MVTYAITLGHFQKEFLGIAYDYRYKDLGSSLFFSIFGPFGLLISVFSSGLVKHGLLWKPLPKSVQANYRRENDL